MIDSVLAGGIGYLLGISDGERNQRKHDAGRRVRYHNELIEYDKYLEKKKRDEEHRKQEAERKKAEFERTHCLICGEKIEHKIETMINPGTLGRDVRVTAYCGCGIPFTVTEHDCLWMDYDEDHGFGNLQRMWKTVYDDLKLREREKLEQKQRKSW